MNNVASTSIQPVAPVGRFAPTPSGRMHIGNMVAMLAAWLVARSQGGRILLRLEDIDIARMPRDASQWIMDDLMWAGLDWDGEPMYQHQRTDIYETALRFLQPYLYPCFCSRSDIRAVAAPQEGDGFIRYPGTCRHLKEDNPSLLNERLNRGDQHSLRLAAPQGVEGCVIFNDRVFGKQTFELDRDLGDMVLRRADGLFSYQLAVVVDDVLSGVNDIVRGRDLLRSTALQKWIAHLLQESGFFAQYGASYDDSVQYAHLPLIDDAQGERLAKRKHSLDVGALRESGWTAERMIGYCMWLLGLRIEGEESPIPLSAREALQYFSWDLIRSDLADRKVDVNRLDRMVVRMHGVN